MSNKFQGKNKRLHNLELKTASEVWNKTEKGSYRLNNKFNYYGRVEKGLGSFVVMPNKKGQNAKFIVNTNELTNKVKNEIVDNLVIKINE